jgi:hypothetical protein
VWGMYRCQLNATSLSTVCFGPNYYLLPTKLI